VEWYPEGNVWVSAVLLKTRGGVGYLKALFSANVLIEGLALARIFNV